MVLAALVALAGCATPVGVSHLDARSVQRQLTQSALTGDRPSAASREVLTQLGLRERFRADPDGTLAVLHEGLAPNSDDARLFALAELSFLRADETGSREQALAAAVYAYAFLFPGSGARRQGRFDPRFQIARTVYNLGLARAFAAEPGTTVLGIGAKPAETLAEISMVE
jgi:hypothetical protein